MRKFQATMDISLNLLYNKKNWKKFTLFIKEEDIYE